MKSTYKFLALFMGILLLTGCSSDSDEEIVVPTIKITTSDFTIDDDNSQAKAVFSINVDWTTTISYEGEVKDWLTISPEKGEAGNNQEIVMTAIPNIGSAERKAFVTINYGGKPHKLTVVQSKMMDKDITSSFDKEFAKMLEREKYIPNADIIMLSDVTNIKELILSPSDEEQNTLTSISGLEYFKSLTYLFFDINKITQLDLRENTNLTQLSCSSLDLTGLDVTKNTKLKILMCNNNELSTLDLSKNTQLEVLWCNDNKLSTLDISKNDKLTSLDISYNNFTSFDISGNEELRKFRCVYNKLSTLDISKNTELQALWCYNNQLSTLDISKNVKLISFECNNNPGDEITFVIKSWFDNENIPDKFTKKAWFMMLGSGEMIKVDINYQKVN